MCDFSKATDYDIGCEVLKRSKVSDSIQVVVNDRQSANFSIAVDRGDLLVDKGEAMIVIFKGLY
jgi:hypothetical protein